MFRFNPGQNKKVFPPKNSYTKVVGADIVLNNAKNQAKRKFETWETVKTKKGQLKVSSKHGKNEKAENIEIASYFTDKYNHKIKLLGRSDTQKTADAFNETLNIEREYKRNTKPTISAIDNEIRGAAKQANHIVLDIQSEISEGDLRDGIHNRVKRCENLKEITIIKGNTDKTYLKDDILKENWKL
ncbi:CdiA C-terminal domain-containing protein [Tenacibaculum piscium]|uniref:CdiA C-terminal domain-containing protein n=1 Tax=Tenacibaculum piscium TaxID=1458515 RepID=UPI001F391C9A|nr:hypothetical protein [Tenacibaculum piscium]